MHFRREIEGLRALAVMPVVLFHAGVPGFGGGFAGVDVFFVISGYLITLTITEAQAAGTFTFAHFYERRARRLLPALFPVLAASFALAWLVMIPPDFRWFSQSLGTSAVFAANMLFARRTGYFDNDEGYAPLLHLWSLSVEEQFYIVFPVLVIGLMALRRRCGPEWLVAAAFAVLATASFALSLALMRTNQPLAFFSLPTRAWELLAGAICAVLPHRQGNALWALAGLGLIAAGFVLVDPMATPGWTMLLPVAGTALALRHADPRNLAGKLLALAPLPALGAASYGIYLWHNPLLATLHYTWFGRPPVWLTGALVALSVLLGFVSLILIERPVRAGRLLRTRRSLIVVCGAGLLLALGIGAGGHLYKIRPRSFVTNEALANHAPPGEHDTALIPPQGRAIDFVVFGDSHARQYFPALQQRLGSGALLTVPGCLSLPQSTSRDERSDMAAACAEQPDALVRLVAERRIGTVIWSQRWDRDLFAKDSLQPLGRSLDKGWPALREGIVKLRAALPAATRLVIVGNVPTARAAGGALESGYVRCRSFANADCAETFPRHMAEGHHINPMLAGVASQLPGTRYVDSAQALCNADACALVQEGKSIYVDWTHLTAFGADKVVELILPEVQRSSAEQ
ncbi:MAG: acyltransferase family protein [Novosphingobium sp.]|nr:acyltransferase family protein [Novosphingobium sp.]